MLSLILPFMLVGCGSKPNKEYYAGVEDGDTVKLTLFTYDGKGESHFGLMNLGHTFLSFENISSENVNIGKMSVAPGETVAVGTWSVLSHFGIWYNLEGNYIDFNNKYDGRVSITIGINNDDLVKVNKFIEENDRWNPIKNCSYFALNLYNTVAGDTESIPCPVIYTPTYIAEHIRAFVEFDENKAIECDGKFGYFDNDTYVEYSFTGETNESN